jgi:hypothetical protein
MTPFTLTAAARLAKLECISAMSQFCCPHGDMLLTCRHLPEACKPLAKRVLPYYMVLFDAATDMVLQVWHGILLRVSDWRRARRRHSHDRRHVRQQVRSCMARSYAGCKFANGIVLSFVHTVD